MRKISNLKGYRVKIKYKKFHTATLHENALVKENGRFVRLKNSSHVKFRKKTSRGLKIKLDGCRSLMGSHSLKVLTYDPELKISSYKQLSELTLNDGIIVHFDNEINHTDVELIEGYDDVKAYPYLSLLIGFFVGGGEQDYGKPLFAEINPMALSYSIMEQLQAMLLALEIDYDYYHNEGLLVVRDNHFIRVMYGRFLSDKDSERFVHDYFLRAPRSIQLPFLHGLLLGGLIRCFNGHSTHPRFGGALTDFCEFLSETLALDIQTMFLKFGIAIKVVRIVAGEGYRVFVYSEYYDKLSKLLGFYDMEALSISRSLNGYLEFFALPITQIEVIDIKNTYEFVSNGEDICYNVNGMYVKP